MYRSMRFFPLYVCYDENFNVDRIFGTLAIYVDRNELVHFVSTSRVASEGVPYSIRAKVGPMST